MMKRTVVLVAILGVLLAGVAAAKEKLTPEEIIAKHLDSIGPKAAREAASSREITGTAHMQQLMGGAGVVDGESLVLSEANKVKVGMKFANNEYPQEQFVFDGKDVLIGRIRPTSRSAVGDFLFANPLILKEGLLGGTLSSAWPLLDMSAHRAKLSYDGLKKVGERQLHRLTYDPKGSGDRLTIKLFFEPETFRHVMTVYTFVRGLGVVVDSARSEYEQELQETFEDFRTVGGMTLPSSYSLRYTTQENLGTKMWKWELKFDKMNGAAFPTAGQ